MKKMSLFPEPEKYEIHDGIYNLPNVLTFTGYSGKKIISSAEAVLGFYKEKKENDTAAVFTFELLEASESENYTLTISSSGLKISASSEKGLLNGILTAKQLILNYNKKLPYLHIADSPKVSWRGIMLDVCRHFHGVNEIKRLIPILGMLKINILHLHLTEDQGWRLESKKYPKLTEIGAFRDKTMITRRNPRTYRNTAHGGFYTQNEIKEIIELSALYNIEVVPEIEMPGHALAALASYPELGCNSNYEVCCDFGIFKDVMCLGKENTLEFCRNIITETAELFPSEYIHIGGDEVPTEKWENCEHCQKQMKELNLTKYRDLQHWFNEEIRKHAADLGKKIICWNEAIHPYLEKDVVIQFWKKNRNLFADFLGRGGKGIISEFDDFYFDHSHRYSSLKDVYTGAQAYADLITGGNILGLEAPLWTEWIPNRERLDHQLFPRTAALAEAAWNGGKNIKAFLSADVKDQLYSFLKKLGVFPAPKELCNPKILFKKKKRLKEHNRMWDTMEYRRMPVAGVPADIKTKIR